MSTKGQAASGLLDLMRNQNQGRERVLYCAAVTSALRRVLDPNVRGEVGGPGESTT